VTFARKLLIFGGAALAALGMAYGLSYAVFTEHQTLDRIGGSLAGAFSAAAQRDHAEAASALSVYSATKFDYVRQVDVHSHWVGLAMLLMVLGVIFDEVGFGNRIQVAIAVALLAGAVLFPLGVILQTTRSGGFLPSAVAIAGSALVIAGLAATAVGFARGSPS